MVTREQIARHLRIAREAVGMTQEQVAAALELRRPAITDMENGKRNVSSDELYQLATLYGRSVSELLEGSPLDAATSVLFRSTGQVGPETRAAVFRFLERCRSERELRTLLGAAPMAPARPYAPMDPPLSAAQALADGERLAERERERLKLGHEPVRDPIGLVEDQGVCVGRLDPLSTLDGIYVNAAPVGPCVGVNDTRDRWTGYRTTFTVLHEYGHWLFDGVTAEPLTAGRFTTDLCEVRANAFASAFLMPRPAVHRFFNAAGQLSQDGGIERLTPVLIVRAMHHFGVSRQALLLRLRTLRLISQPTWADPALCGFSLAPVAKALGIDLKVDHPLDARFRALIAQAWSAGFITTSRAASLRGIDVDAFRDEMELLGAEVNIPADMLPAVTLA